MARITIYSSGDVFADRDIEPPQVNWLHSIGGGHGVPRHDRARHAAGLPHECARVRSGRVYCGQLENLSEARRLLSEQYAAHDITWVGWPEEED